MKDDTKLVAAGRPHQRPLHPVSAPVERASTYLFPTYDDFILGAKNISYGRLGTPTHRALEEAITALEGGVETRLVSSGHQACAAAIQSFVSSGDHVLMADSVYDPTRKFAEYYLKRFGVETTYFDPTNIEDLASLARDTTKVIFAESPGSLTFEVQDLPALAAMADDIGARLIVDNTWAAGYYCKPIALGASVSVQAATKFLNGHSDLLLGSITSADEATAKLVFRTLLTLGTNVSADDAYLTLRGMRSMAARLDRHEATGLMLAKWLAKRPEVDRVLHPAMKSCPGHAIWKRDFTGSSGLFSIVLKPVSQEAIEAFFNALKLFAMGFSWGGFESLCIHVKPQYNRTAVPWAEEGPVFRFHSGLEDQDDLIVDLERAFGAMNSIAKPKSDSTKRGHRQRKRKK